jgi:carbon-monoxide dehydrogenase small subunit/xanthine dehydrogenase small subunit
MTAVHPVITDTWRFHVNGRTVAAEAPGGRRLLDVLRDDLGLTGTKEGCGEGECGACAVLMDGTLVNACLVPVCHADGRDIVTVEGLATAGGQLDPLQQAFLELGGTQCGFCTPGMLLASRALLASGHQATEPAIREAIAGNLCRCTGYTKIIEAVEAAGDDWRPAPLVAPGPEALSSPVTPVSVPATAGPRVVRPVSVADAVARLAADPTLRPIAGGTDVLVELAAGVADQSRPLLDLWDLDELRVIEIEHDELVLGALTTYADLRHSPVVHGALPVLAEVAASVGAVAIQNRGTIGGNCVTASPAADVAPLLLATDARFEIVGMHRTRLVEAGAFWPGYRRTALEPGELVAAVRIPLVPGREVHVRKVGTRRAQSIAKVSLAVAWQTAPGTDGDGTWHDVRVALGSVAPTPIRAPRTEATLERALPSPEVAALAAATVRDEITPIDDVRSTAAYRRAVAGRVLRRIILDAAG